MPYFPPHLKCVTPLIFANSIFQILLVTLILYLADGWEFSLRTRTYVLTAVAPKSPQNDRYASTASKERSVAKERLLWTASTLNKSLAVSDCPYTGVSVEANGPDIRWSWGEEQWRTHSCDVLLTQRLLPVTHEVSGEFLIFQQHSAPARETIDLLEPETPAFISADRWPPTNTGDLNMVNY